MIATTTTTNKKLALPEEIFPLGVKFRVEVVNRIDDEGSVGETVGDLRLIRIDAQQDSRRRWTTLLHEYIHATLHIVGIGNEMDVQVEEVIVQSLEHSLEQFMMAHGETFLKSLESQK
jgi:hypothetical protein